MNALLKITWLPVLTVSFVLTAAAAEPAAAESEKGTRLLLGFEMDEYEKIAKPWIRNGKPKWRVKAGYPYYLYAPNKAESSQGKHSRCKSFKRGMNLPPRDSGKLRRSVTRRGATILRSCGWHHLCFGRDWSKSAAFWVDVKATVSATLAIEIEDELSPVLLARTFQVPEGKWVTIAFDLASAEKARLLDRGKIVSFYILCEKIAKGASVYIDNIRLASSDAKPNLPLIEDSTPWQRPPEPPSKDGGTTRPEKPEPLTLKPDLTPIPADEKPVTLKGKGPAWGNSLHKVARGIGAFDSKQLSSILMAPTGGMRVSNDGGAKWGGLNGKPYTVVASGSNTPNRHGFFCEPTEALCVYITHCAGGGSPSNTWFRRVAFDGKKWTPEPVRIIDPDVRHCPEWYEVIRLPNGRLWAAWDHYQRHKGITIFAKFSDDNGKTWQHGGKLGNVSPSLNLGSSPRLVAFGEDGAGIVYWWRAKHKVYFSRFDQDAFDRMYQDYLKQKPGEKLPWDRFATNRAWTEPSALPKGERVVSALGMPDGKVFAAVSKPSSVLVWDGKSWKESLADGTGVLTRCGEKAVLVFKRGENKKVSFRVLSDGKWGEARVCVEEPGGVKSLAVPRVAPPNFFPLAWSITEDKDAIRTLRVGMGGKP